VLHSNTLTSHSPSARMLRGVSTIGLPQFAQVGDVGMAQVNAACAWDVPSCRCERFGSDWEPIRVQTRKMKYFFHLEDGACIRDPKGTDFADDAAAMYEATKVAQELSKLRVHAYEWSVVVKNADGLRVGSVPLTPGLAANAQDDPMLPTSVH